MDWSRPRGDQSFYSTRPPERPNPGGAEFGGLMGGKTRLPTRRQAVVDETHQLIASRWVNGGLVSGLYSIEPFQASYIEPSLTPDLPIPPAASIPHALEVLANQGLLPPELVGCSTALLEEHAAVWPETLAQFGDAIYWALRDGGAYSERIPDAEAEERTRDYLRALAGETAAERLHFFGLDPAFSCWFNRLYWDFAYVAVNRREKWLAVVCATDTD